MNDIVSIIIPVYNGEKYIGQCLKSLMMQTYSNIQIVVVDDGSTDATYDECSRLAQIDSRILLIHKENGGVSKARNTGIDHIKGDHVMFVDSDDWLEPDAVELMYTEIKKNDAEVCYSNVFYKDENQLVRATKLEEHVYTAGDILMRHCSGGFVSSACVGIYSRTIASQCRFDEDIYTLEDWLYNAEVLSLSKTVAVISIAFYHYRTNQESVSQTKLDSRKMTCFQIPQRLFSFWKNNNIQPPRSCNDVPYFFVNSMAVILARKAKLVTKEVKVHLKREARKALSHKPYNVRRQVVFYIILCAVNPGLFCAGFQLKNRKKCE